MRPQGGGRTATPMGDTPRYLRATMIFGAADQLALFQQWAELMRGYAEYSGFHSAYLLRGYAQAPAAAGLTLFTERGAHDRTMRQIEDASPLAPGRLAVRDVVPISFQLTTFTGEPPEEPFTARLLLHREQQAATPALRGFLDRRRQTADGPAGDAVCTGKLLDGGRLYCSLVLVPTPGRRPVRHPPGRAADVLPEDPVCLEHLRDWWCFAAVATVGDDGRVRHLGH